MQKFYPSWVETIRLWWNIVIGGQMRISLRCFMKGLAQKACLSDSFWCVHPWYLVVFCIGNVICYQLERQSNVLQCFHCRARGLCPGKSNQPRFNTRWPQRPGVNVSGVPSYLFRCNSISWIHVGEWVSQWCFWDLVNHCHNLSDSLNQTVPLVFKAISQGW